MKAPYQPSPRVLLIDGSDSSRQTYLAQLQQEGFVVSAPASLAQARQDLLEYPYDLVVLDLGLHEAGDALQFLNTVLTHQPESEILVLTDHSSKGAASAGMKQGVYDYLHRPVDPEQLLHALRKALERQRLRRQVSYLQHQFEREAGLSQIVAVSASMKEILRVVRTVASSDATVLVEGESGTGKELLAKLVHQRSRRCSGPFLAINCGALPETLLESELFGHLRGSFTGAHKDRKGLFEAAHGGTLFLDEIAETSAGFQVKLLRALQERTVRRLGDTRETSVDVRIIAASNQSLGQLVRAGRFRQDLFFRLNVIPIRLLPLRERRDDILPLADSFLKLFSDRMGRRPPRLSEAARQKLLNYDWLGNVRELENVLERALILNRGDVIEVTELLLESGLPPECQELMAQETVLISLAEAEKRHILKVLDHCQHNKTKAAQILGIGYNTLWRKLSKYGLR
jgi:two-component system response regulator HydG